MPSPAVQRGLSCISHVVVWLLALAGAGSAQARTRTERFFPNLPGYVTLKCDFHMHTVFSDGTVWPTVRVEEAWREGLDVLAITDHIEVLPHTNDVIVRFERPYQLARPAAAALGLLLVPGAEITRGEPPGHWNVLFVTNLTALRTNDYRDALAAAAAQGGFIFWVHPWWKQPDKKSVWYSEQQEVLRAGRLHGLEIVNGDYYDPISHRWCIDKQLALLGTTDAHGPVMFDYDLARGEHRPLTLVFAKERTVEAVREALFARRTVVCWKNQLFGEAQYLAPLFHRSLELSLPQTLLKGKGRVLVQVRNRAAIPFELELDGKLREVIVPQSLRLPAGQTALLEVQGTGTAAPGKKRLLLPYLVKNLKPTPEEGLAVQLRIPLTFAAPGK